MRRNIDRYARGFISSGLHLQWWGSNLDKNHPEFERLWAAIEDFFILAEEVLDEI